MTPGKTEKYPSRIVVKLLRLVAYLISKPCWFVKFRGLENIPPESLGGLIIASNHQTYIDPVWITIPLNRRLRYMAFDQAFTWKRIGRLISYLGAFPVGFDGGSSRIALKNAFRTLDEGSALIVFPEGAREFADGKLFPFKHGAIRIAVQKNIPVLPITIRGGNRIWPQKQKYPTLFRRVEVIFHPPMHITRVDGIDRRLLIEQQTENLKSIIESALYNSESQ